MAVCVWLGECARASVILCLVGMVQTTILSRSLSNFTCKQKRSTEGCSKLKGMETRQAQERLVSTLEHMQVPKWDRTRCPEE